MSAAPATEEISLRDSLDAEWIKLPLAVMRDVGPACQTLGGLLKLTSRETFSSHAAIAKRARLPVRTVRAHLATLAASGWIEDRGREHTRAGRPRRTCTLAITPRARAAAKESYAVLPWWAGCHIHRVGRLPWSTRAVLSVVMARLMTMKAGIERSGDGCLDPNDLEGSIEEMGGAGRFRFTLDHLEATTGLARGSIIRAKCQLRGLGIIKIYADDRDDGGTPRDLLWPRENWRVRVTHTSPGRCWLAFVVHPDDE
jgi:hypothetical protein